MVRALKIFSNFNIIMKAKTTDSLLPQWAVNHSPGGGGPAASVFIFHKELGRKACLVLSVARLQELYGVNS